MLTGETPIVIDARRAPSGFHATWISGGELPG